jgi:predicted esterase
MRLFHRLAVGLMLLAVAAGCTASSDPKRATLPELVARFLAAEDPLLIAEEILATGASAKEIAALLRAGQTYSAVEDPGWRVLEPPSVKSVTRPFHLYVPTTYDPGKRHKVLFDLHGAVIGSGFAVEELARRRVLWESVAEQERMLLVVPHGDREVHWWGEAGRQNLGAQLAYLKREFNIHENRVYLSGFSDGASGAYWAAFHDPTPWAGFIALHGNPAIPDRGDYPCYPRNLLNRPIRATNGARDTIYPAHEIRVLIDQMLLLGVDIDWTIYDAGHDIDFFSTERGFSTAFLRSTSRDPARTRIAWETSDPRVGRCDWVRIDAIEDVGDNATFEEINFWHLAGSLDPGVWTGATTSDGVTVAGILPGTVAHSAGVRRGDVISRIGDRAVTSSTDLSSALQGVEPGTSLVIVVLRDGERLELVGQVPGLDPVYRRPGVIATVDVTAEGNRIDVAVRNVRRYSLLLSSAMFDLALPIVVVTNGAVSFDGVVTADPRFMLEQAAKDRDRTAVYEGRITIDLSPS